MEAAEDFVVDVDLDVVGVADGVGVRAGFEAEYEWLIKGDAAVAFGSVPGSAEGREGRDGKDPSFERRLL